MIRVSLFAGAIALCLAPVAQAQYNSSYGYHNPNQQYQSNCTSQRDDNRAAGALIGAVAGGLLGVAIADDNDDHYRRGNRGYYGNRGHRGYSNGDGDEIAGALIGGVLGAVVGSEIASSGTECHNYSSRYAQEGIAPPTRQPFATGQANNTVYQTNYPVQDQPLYGGPETTTGYGPGPAQTYSPECTTVQRETQLPDGAIIREPVDVCRDGNGNWQIAGEASLY